MGLLLKAEELPLSFETEKVKANILRKVQLMLASELVPEIYIQACYRYAIGCFWVKFSPLYQPAFDILEEIFKHQNFLSEHLTIVEQLGYLLQLGEDNDELFKTLKFAI